MSGSCVGAMQAFMIRQTSTPHLSHALDHAANVHLGRSRRSSQRPVACVWPRRRHQVVHCHTWHSATEVLRSVKGSTYNSKDWLSHHVKSGGSGSSGTRLYALASL